MPEGLRDGSGGDALRTVLHVGPAETRGGMGAVIRLLAAHPPEGWQARTFTSHADGGHLHAALAWGRAWWSLHQSLVGVDLVHVHVASRWSWRRKKGLIEIARKAGIPVVLSIHSGDFDAHCAKHGPEVHFVCAGIHPVVLTETWRQRLEAWMPHAKVIPNPVPEVPVNTDRNRHRFLLMSRPNPMKGQAIAIAATRLLRDRGHDVDLHLTGTTVQEPGVVGRGWIEGSERDQLLASAGTLLSPSEWEGMSMTVIEAMARGMPVLASAASEGVFEAAGLVVERTPSAFADAMKAMLSGGAWGEMAAAGPLEAESYRLSTVVPQWGALYDEVVG